MSATDLAPAPASGLTRRVALLAKPGQAREQLRRALEGAGASIVLEADPGTLECAALEAAAVQVVLIALDPGTEDSLARFETVLDDPAVAVIYEEAELAARREGWEAQRWSRHLSAKLFGHADVLPPGGEDDPAAPEPGRPTTPAQLQQGAPIEPHLQEARSLSMELPSGGFQSPAAPEEKGLYLDLEPEAWKPRADTEVLPITGESLGIQAPALELELELEAAVPAANAPTTLELEPEAEAARAIKVPMTLELELELEPEAGASSSAAAPEAIAPKTRRGALLVFAGIGGPDAVRKVLAELPPNLSRPVVVRLRLDGGRYDNLVKQMARVSVLPVALAVAGTPALPQCVHVLPSGVGMQVVDGVVHFTQADTDLNGLIAALPPGESAILMLSGSNAEQVDAVMSLASRGAFVAGQSTQGCYDAVASKALAALGATTGSPAQLAAGAVAHLGA